MSKKARNVFILKLNSRVFTWYMCCSTYAGRPTYTRTYIEMNCKIYSLDEIYFLLFYIFLCCSKLPRRTKKEQTTKTHKERKKSGAQNAYICMLNVEHIWIFSFLLYCFFLHAACSLFTVFTHRVQIFMMITNETWQNGQCWNRKHIQRDRIESFTSSSAFEFVTIHFINNKLESHIHSWLLTHRCARLWFMKEKIRIKCQYSKQVQRFNKKYPKSFRIFIKCCNKPSA